MIEYPYNNKIIADGLKKLCQNKIYNLDEKEIEKIKNLKTPFLNTNPDDLDSYGLSKFWWDFDYIFSNSNQELDFLACLIVDYYFENKTELENGYMISQLVKSLTKTTKNEQNITEKIKSVKNLTNLGFVHLFKDENKTNNSVQIMTIHKSKGDEFDYVFIPEMSSKLFSLDEQDVKISGENYFCECLKPKEKRKTLDELKKEQIAETLHLIYVGITRAKKQLWLSCPKNIKRGAKNLFPCEVFFLDDKSNDNIENQN